MWPAGRSQCALPTLKRGGAIRGSLCRAGFGIRESKIPIPNSGFGIRVSRIPNPTLGFGIRDSNPKSNFGFRDSGGSGPWIRDSGFGICESQVRDSGFGIRESQITFFRSFSGSRLEKGKGAGSNSGHAKFCQIWHQLLLAGWLRPWCQIPAQPRHGRIAVSPVLNSTGRVLASAKPTPPRHSRTGQTMQPPPRWSTPPCLSLCLVHAAAIMHACCTS